MIRARRLLAAALAVSAVVGLAGCTSTVSLKPALDANEPACANVTVRLPDTVAGESRRWTDAQATGSWGDPSAVILTCGVEVPGPSTLVCQTVKGVDWIIDDTDAPNYRFTTFGREPAVQVYLDYDRVSGQQVLTDLATAVTQLPTNGSTCTDRPAE